MNDLKDTLDTLARLSGIICGAMLFWALYDFLKKGTELFKVAKAYLLSPRNVNVTVADKVADELKRMFDL